ncbi:MAG: Gfo/Idh/MocA family oxidoreductase [Bryobacterales bacterium]|nr:Gfo/Idh/MocA family oxidoreductase [Bryobacterales bacterium]
MRPGRRDGRRTFTIMATTRRNFVTGAAMGAGLAAASRQASAQVAPSDTVRLGVVGIRGRGRSHIREFAAMPDVRVAYLCDVDERLFGEGISEAERIGGYSPETETDIRRLLERDDLDAISVATPDHWHALMTIWACQAGKDVYCEKPCSYTLREGRKMVEAARKYGRMVQIGLQRRSSRRVRSVARFVREGGHGKAYRAKAVVYRGRISIGKVSESSIPEGVNWDLYLGPAPYRAFDLNRFHYGWHFFWDTSTSEVGNNGVHHLDVLRWGLDKHVHPVRIHCAGGQFLEDSDSEVPNVQVGTFEYSDGTLVEIEATTLYSPPFGGVRVGGVFFTDRGYVTSDERWSAVEGRFTPRDRPDSATGVSYRTNNLSFPDISYHPGPEIPNLEEPEVSHFRNFIDCVRSRNREALNCEVEQGHLSTSLCHLANISYRVGRKLEFDPDSETFAGDDEANRLLTRQYREPYVVPDQV